jgi:putative two-component system response regulator
MVLNNHHRLSLVLLDIMMPEMDGFQVLDVLKSGGYTQSIPVIIITASGGDENEIKGLHAGAVDFVNKPFHPEIVKCRVDAQVELKKHRDHLEELVEFNVRKIVSVREAVIEFMASIIEYRDTESGQHVQRTRLLADLLSKLVLQSGLMKDELSGFEPALFSKAVPLHDIGKITTPDSILLKPGRLTPEEFEIIKKHTVMGAEIITKMKTFDAPEYVKYCYDICLYHHERWDGKGYPTGLSGNSIPCSARMMAIVDVYDALVSERPYKKPFSHEEAMGIISGGRGTQFDPVLVDVFMQNNEQFYDFYKH